MVGTLGKALLRWGVVTARALSLPPLIRPSAEGSRAPVRDVRDESARLAFVQLGAQVQRSALPVGGVIELTRLGLGQRGEFGQGVDACSRVDHQHIGHAAQQGHRGNLLGLVRQLAVQRRADRQWRRGHEQGVTICRRTRRLGRTQVATGTGLVVDDDGLAQFERQLGGDQTGHVVDQSTRREGHHQLDGAGGPGLGQR
jgi:hypothetical protein